MSKLPVVANEMVKKFQCPGCIHGYDPTNCEKANLQVYPAPSFPYFMCTNHYPSTFVNMERRIYLGLPVGLSSTGMRFHDPAEQPHEQKYFSVNSRIRLWAKGTSPKWDKFNLPIWALDWLEGYLVVRTFMPRVNESYLDVVEGATRAELCPQAVDISEFESEMD